MDAGQLKKDLEMYAGYKYTNSQELKVVENSMFNSIVSYLRPIEKDIHIKQTQSKEISETIKKEAVLQELNEIKQVSNYYFIDELVLSIMSNAHNDWLLAHKEDLKEEEIKNPEKFAPFELLTMKEVNEYLKVLIPIFNILDIQIDNNEIERAFSRNQLIFMLKNEIFTAEDFKEKIMHITELKPELFENCETTAETIQDLYAQESVAQSIVDSVKERVHLNVTDRFKEVLLEEGDNVGFLVTRNHKRNKQVYKFSDNISQKKIGFRKHALPRPEKPVKKVFFQLAKSGGFILAQNVKISDYKYYDYTQKFSQFIDYKDCNDEQKRAIDRRKRKLKRFVDNIEYNNDADTPGVISLVSIKHDQMNFYEKSIDIKQDEKETIKKEVIQIPITQRELAKMKILPEEVGWEKEKRAKLQSSQKVYLCAPDKRLKKQNDFKDLLAEMSKMDNSNDQKISMQKIKEVYHSNKEKDENVL